MRSKKISVLLGVFIALGVLIVIIYLLMRGSATPVHDVEADFILSSVEIAEAYDSDESTAQRRFNGKVVEITGEVIDELIDLGSNTRSLILQGSNLTEVRCNFIPAEQENVQRINIGQIIRVKGRVQGHMNLEVVINNCILLEEMAGERIDAATTNDTLEILMDTEMETDRTRTEIDTLPQLPQSR